MKGENKSSITKMMNLFYPNKDNFKEAQLVYTDWLKNRKNKDNKVENKSKDGLIAEDIESGKDIKVDESNLKVSSQASGSGIDQSETNLIEEYYKSIEKESEIKAENQDEAYNLNFDSIYFNNTKPSITSNISRPVIKPRDELELRHEDIYYNNKDIVDRIIYQTCPLYDTTPFFDHTYDEKSKLDETKNPLRKHKDSALAA